MRALILGAASLGCVAVGMLGCGSEPAEPRPPLTAQPYAPPPATVYRLTDAQWRASVADLTGVTWAGPLPPDYRLHGYANVGASEASVSPRDLEQLENAVWMVAQRALPDAAARQHLLGCAVGGDDASDDARCVRAFAAQFGRRAWRRPLAATELDRLVAVYETVTPTLGPQRGAQSVLAALLLAPDFTYQANHGAPIDGQPGRVALTDWELAARLALVLTGSGPDEVLLDAATAGELTTEAGLRAQAERLLDHPRARDTLTAWFAETLDLDKLATVDKDAALFPQLNPAVRAAMADELHLLFTSVVFEQQRPYRDLLTTDAAWADPALAAIYHVSQPVPGMQPITLPASQARGGLLGRAALLTLNAHSTVNSPTHRGRFVRTRLLCHAVPPPPPGIVTELPPGGTGTLRQQLSQHAADIQCASCHQVMDPIGFGLERFDAIGQHRVFDNGFPIDSTGTLDGASFDGAAELGDAVANHPDFAGCVALNLYRWGTGQAERRTDLPEVDALTAAFTDADQRLRALVLAFVLSPSFRTASAPLGAPCDTEGDARTCVSACGDGVETCIDGRYRGCTAPTVDVETCDGADQDCDGEIDEDLERACVINGLPGTATCAAGAWAECRPAPGPIELCNGLDDDGDGQVDEDLDLSLVFADFSALAASHGDCDAATAPNSGPCRAAVHRRCASHGCGVSGFAIERADDGLGLACLSDTRAELVDASFSTLAEHHDACAASNQPSGPCNAAIHRFCAATGRTTGFGPVEHSGDYAAIVCTPGAVVANDGTYTELRTFSPSCDGHAERQGPACSAAIHQACVARGYATGHGPVENTGDTSVFACVEP